MTLQPQSLRLTLPVNGPGQHLASILLGADALPLYTGDRVWIRRHNESGRFAVYMAEYWGEAVHGETLVRANPGPDWPMLLDPDAIPLVGEGKAIRINGQPADFGAVTIRQTDHAIESTTFLDTEDFGGSLRMLLHARHPVVYGTLTIKSKKGDMPPLTPIWANCSFPNAQPISLQKPLCDCKVRFDFGIRSLTPSTDAEHQHAYANAIATVRGASAVPVSP